MSTPEQIAAAMFEECLTQEQSALTVRSEDEANAIREHVRALARARGTKIRTARMDDAVLVVRLDAGLWHEDTATMRVKLTPHPEGTLG